MSMLVRHPDDNNDEALRPSDTARWKSRGSGSVQEAGGRRLRGSKLSPAVVQHAGPSREPTLLPVLGCRRAAHSSLLPAPDVVVGRVVFSQRQQETAGQKATGGIYSDSNIQRQGQLATQDSALDKRDCRRGRANFQRLVDGQAGSSLLLVVRFCFGLLQPRSLAPLGNADKKVQAAWRRGEGTSWCCRLSEGGALPQLLVRAPSSPSRPSLMRWSRSTPDPASSQ